MDAYEATRIVFSRIQALDPENAAKIMGLLLIQDHGDKEMIRLAFGPEALLHSLILRARKDLGLNTATTTTAPANPPSPSSFFLSRQISSGRGGGGGPNSPSSWAPPPPLDVDVGDEYLLQEQLSFLNEQAEAAAYWGEQGAGWKPCLYFARGFCKNGSSCRFLHGPADDMSAAVEQQCQELMLMRSKSQRLAASAAAAAAAFPYSPTGTTSSGKCFNFMLQQQQQNESQRAAAAAALMLENENCKFMGRQRIERIDFAGMANPGSRQIYLTFPADSTFREEDVSNYFSIYGPVQDVRIPYQQKRMFGFVTFVYPETVKLILAKGNPHFVCDARVLVKPYKEKGKVPDKKQQQGERLDFSACTTPTGLDISRDPFDLQQQLASARMLYNNQDAILRRKMEEQQAAAELQQAIEMQGRRFMGLQLLDIKNRTLASQTAPLLSPLSTTATTPTSAASFNTAAVLSDLGSTRSVSSSNGSQDEAAAAFEDKSLSPAASATAVSAACQQQTAVNSEPERAAAQPNPNEDVSYQESGEHNLPDSPFASPTKSSLLNECSVINGNGHLISSTLLPHSPPLDSMASFKSSCFFQMPRFSSGHGAVGL